MKIRDLIDELIQFETETSPDEEVYVELRIGLEKTGWHGCLIEGTGTDDDGSVSIMAVAP